MCLPKAREGATRKSVGADLNISCTHECNWVLIIIVAEANQSVLSRSACAATLPFAMYAVSRSMICRTYNICNRLASSSKLDLAIASSSAPSSAPALLPPAQLHAACPTRWSPHAPLTCLLDGQLFRNRSKQLLHILCRFRTGLEEKKASFSSICLGIRCRHGALVGLLGNEVGLVAGEGDDDVLVRLALELLHPGLRFVKRCLPWMSATCSGTRAGGVHTACVIS